MEVESLPPDCRLHCEAYIRPALVLARSGGPSALQLSACQRTGGLLWLFVVSVLILACGLFPAPGEPSRQPVRRPGFFPGTPEGETRPITIYLPRRFQDDSLGLQAVERAVPLEQEPAYAALAAFIRGPNGDERADDFQYPFDRRTRINSVAVNGGTARVNLGPEIDRLRGRPYSELVYWTLVHTLSEVPGVERVALEREGLPLTELGDPAFVVPSVAGRADAPVWARPRSEARTAWPPL